MPDCPGVDGFVTGILRLPPPANAHVLRALDGGSLASAGMQAFGENAGENIFIGTLRGPKWMLALADVCVVANLLGQWQVRRAPPPPISASIGGCWQPPRLLADNSAETLQY